MTIHCVGQVYLDPTESADMTIRPLHKFCTKAHTINTFIITNIIRVPFPLDLDPDRRIIISLPLPLDPSRAELGPCISAQIQPLAASGWRMRQPSIYFLKRRKNILFRVLVDALCAI